ncbi:hypothetical protein AB0N16_17955 [Streptomyces sp. NPDC051105]|uniref:hypothetical protein n=1 Tax=Streptomyces sp. NPDC051105 TaxID=3154843 RepID=UPI00344875AF
MALSALLIALSCLLLPFGALAAWAAYGLADTGQYVSSMAPLADDPDVRDAVADTVGEGIMREVDVGRPMQGTVAPFVREAVRSFTQTRAFRLVWDAGNRATHDAVLRALQNEREEAVTVDLAPVTAQVKDQLTQDHVPLAARIPVQHTAVAVLPVAELDRLRKGFHVLEVAGFWLPVTAVVFAVGGITIAVHRRRAVLATALGTALGGALLGLALTVGRSLTLSGLPSDVSHPAAAAVYDALTSTLRTVSWLLLGLGLAVAALAWLGGRVRRGPDEEQEPALDTPDSSSLRADSQPAGQNMPTTIGNNTTDLSGGYADTTYKLPDYDGLLD